MTRKRRSPGTKTRASSTTPIADDKLTRLLGLQRDEPLTAEDRADVEVIAAAAERGFRLATRCWACGSWISHPASVRAHMGPKCRRAKGVAK